MGFFKGNIIYKITNNYNTILKYDNSITISSVATLKTLEKFMKSLIAKQRSLISFGINNLIARSSDIHSRQSWSKKFALSDLLTWKSFFGGYTKGSCSIIKPY